MIKRITPLLLCLAAALILVNSVTGFLAVFCTVLLFLYFIHYLDRCDVLDKKIKDHEETIQNQSESIEILTGMRKSAPSAGEFWTGKQYYDACMRNMKKEKKKLRVENPEISHSTVELLPNGKTFITIWD